MKVLKYVNIDSFTRPIFKDIEKKEYYGSTDILFPYQESEREVKKKVNESDLLYFGNSFDCEAMGSNPGKIKIEWSSEE